MGAGLSVDYEYWIRQQAVSFRYCLFVSGVPQVEGENVQNGNNQALHREGNPATGADKRSKIFCCNWREYAI